MNFISFLIFIPLQILFLPLGLVGALLVAHRQLLREIGANTASGGVLLADFYGDRFIQIGKSKAGSRALELTDEGLGFGLPFNENHDSVFDDFVRSENLSTGETYFMGSSDKNGPFMVVSECLRFGFGLVQFFILFHVFQNSVESR